LWETLSDPKRQVDVVEARRKEKARRELEECSFAPSISRSPKKRSGVAVFDRLAADGVLRASRRATSGRRDLRSAAPVKGMRRSFLDDAVETALARAPTSALASPTKTVRGEYGSVLMCVCMRA
jgi:hypothetical protein